MFHNPQLPKYSSSNEPLYQLSIERQSAFRALMRVNAERIQNAFGIKLSPGEPSMPECLTVINALRAPHRIKNPIAALPVMKAVRQVFPGVLTKLNRC